MFKTHLMVAFVVASLSGGLAWQLCDMHWRHKWQQAQNMQQEQTIQNLNKTVVIEHKVAQQTALADAQGQQELIYAQNEIKRLRIELDRGALRLRQTQSQCKPDTTISTNTRLDTKYRAEPLAGSREVEQDILAISEYALTAIAQRDACVAILQSDRAILSAH